MPEASRICYNKNMPEKKETAKPVSRRRIGIDARFYGPVGKGLGRYIQEIVDRITSQDTDNDYVVFLSRQNFDLFQPPSPRVKKVLADVRWYGLAEQIKMPFYIWRQKLSLVHFPHFNVPVFCPTKFIVTIHDLILMHYPTPRASTLPAFFYWLKNLAYKIVIKSAVWRAKRILTVSEFTKKDIIKHFGAGLAEKIIVTYEGVACLAQEKKFPPLANKGQELRPQLIGPYLLYVGNAYPHKNLEGLLRAFQELHRRRPELKLVLVGRPDFFYQRLQKLATTLGLWRPGQKSVQANAVIFAGYVPDEQLDQLFRQAKAYIFPSFYEGFGLPPLEAMSAGCPVVSSKRASLPEVLGPAAVYFDPKNKEELIEAVLKVLDDKNLRQELIARGFARVKKYSWRACAFQTLATYRAVLEDN